MRNTYTQIHTYTRTNTCNLCYSWLYPSYRPGVNPHHDCLLINPGLVRSLRPLCFLRVCRPLTHLILPLSASLRPTGAAFNSHCGCQPLMLVTFISDFVFVSSSKWNPWPICKSKVLAFVFPVLESFCHKDLIIRRSVRIAQQCSTCILDI